MSTRVTSDQDIHDYERARGVHVHGYELPHLHDLIRGLIARVRFADSAALDAVNATEQSVRVSMSRIIEVVAEFYSVTTNELRSPRGTNRVCHARHAAMNVALRVTPHTLDEIGRAFGGRHHTSVIYARDKWKALVKTNPRYKQEIRALCLRVAGRAEREADGRMTATEVAARQGAGPQ